MKYKYVFIVISGQRKAKVFPSVNIWLYHISARVIFLCSTKPPSDNEMNINELIGNPV
jgi:hypothetical protein